ncbi:MAG: hypothetical protein EOP44_04965, partial [Sphingobacteriaceae bacterium]
AAVLSFSTLRGKALPVDSHHFRVAVRLGIIDAKIGEANEIPLIAYFSLLNSLGKKDTRIAEIAQKYQVKEAQINLAWMLHYSPWILPIPGTSSLIHFEENLKAVDIQLTEEDMDYLK